MKALAQFLVVFFLGFNHQVGVFAQGTFQNLDFEEANLVQQAPQQFPNYVPIGQALPGWSAYIFGDQQTQVNYNATTLGAPNIALLGPSWSSTEPGIIDGNYSVYLQAEGAGTDVSIQQTGMIPVNDESMEFKAWQFGGISGAFQVSFAGNSLTPVLVSSGPWYNTYAVNIAPYAGTSGTLQFSAIGNNQSPSWINLDDISFSPQAIPEPSPLVLAGIGSVIFALYCRFPLKRP